MEFHWRSCAAICSSIKPAWRASSSELIPSASSLRAETNRACWAITLFVALAMRSQRFFNLVMIGASPSCAVLQFSILSDKKLSRFWHMDSIPEMFKSHRAPTSPLLNVDGCLIQRRAGLSVRSRVFSSLKSCHIFWNCRVHMLNDGNKVDLNFVLL